MPEKAGVKVSMNTAADVIQWRAHSALGLAYLYGNYYFIAEVTTVYHGPLDCVSWLLCFSRRYKVFQANILMLYL